jgi:hypothetical protein
MVTVAADTVFDSAVFSVMYHFLKPCLVVSTDGVSECACHGHFTSESLFKI